MNDYSQGYSHIADPYLKQLRRRRVITGAIVLTIIVGVTFSVILILTNFAASRTSPRVTQQEILDFWISNDYQAVSSACDASLEVTPLEPFYLIFKGFSAFYLGLSESDGEKRMSRMDEAIFSIRKALIDEKAPLRAEATYVLGKAYYHKGQDYYNEVIEYLEQSLTLGYSRTDSWEYLALAAHGAGLMDQSIAYFEKALSKKPGSPELILAAATANAAAGNNARAESLALEALLSTTDEYLAERCSFLLGDLYRASGRNEEALARYEAIKNKNPQSADAWYYEGLIFSQSGDPIRARAAWRKAISIDPMHASARLKLSERS